MISIIAYSDPCTIEICPDGKLIGKAGYANEDIDQGKWWIENECWHRQWSRWAWGETGIYHVRLDGDVIKLFDEDGWLIDRYVAQKEEKQ